MNAAAGFFVFLALLAGWAIYRLTVENRRIANDEKTIRGLNELLRLRVQVLESFNDSVCHDLHAPLRGIEGFSEAILEDYGDKLDDRGRDYLRRLRSACVRMRDLLRDLLRLSTLTNDQLMVTMRDFSVSSLAEEVAAELSSSPKYAKHVCVVQSDMAAAGDRELVKLLLTNLISNAFKFSSGTDEPIITVGRSGGEFFVEDNGIGFSPSDSGRLFQPFVRLHQRGDFPGTGIGLAIAKRVVDLHGGKIRAEGRPGRGATFYFTLGGL